MKEEKTFDYSQGYDFETVKILVNQGAKEQNISVQAYLTDGKNSFDHWTKTILDDIAKSNNPIDIAIMIDKYNTMNRMWTYLHTYEYEMKLQPSEK